MILNGSYDQAVKQCDVSIAHNEKKVSEFEKWAEEESKKDVLPEGGRIVHEGFDSPLLAHPGSFFWREKSTKTRFFLRLAISRRLWYSM